MQHQHQPVRVRVKQLDNNFSSSKFLAQHETSLILLGKRKANAKQREPGEVGTKKKKKKLKKEIKISLS